MQPLHPHKVSIVFLVEVVYYLFCLAFCSCVLDFLKVFIKGAVYNLRLFYDCVVISLFFSLYEYEHFKICWISTDGGGTSSYVAHHNAHE